MLGNVFESYSEDSVEKRINCSTLKRTHSQNEELTHTSLIMSANLAEHAVCPILEKLVLNFLTKNLTPILRRETELQVFRNFQQPPAPQLAYSLLAPALYIWVLRLLESVLLEVGRAAARSCDRKTRCGWKGTVFGGRNTTQRPNEVHSCLIRKEKQKRLRK